MIKEIVTKTLVSISFTIVYLVIKHFAGFENMVIVGISQILMHLILNEK